MELDTYIALHLETYDERTHAEVFDEAIRALRAAGFRVKGAAATDDARDLVSEAIYG